MEHRAAWSTFVLLLAGLACLGWAAHEAQSYTANVRLEALYTHAPGCGGGAPVERTAPACQEETLTIVNHDQAEVGTANNPTTNYYLTLRMPDGRHQLFNLGTDTTLWAKVGVGDTVTAQVWQGGVTLLRAGDVTARTDANPLGSPRASILYLVVAVLCALFFVGLSIFPARQWRRSRGQVATSSTAGRTHPSGKEWQPVGDSASVVAPRR